MYTQQCIERIFFPLLFTIISLEDQLTTVIRRTIMVFGHAKKGFIMNIYKKIITSIICAVFHEEWFFVNKHKLLTSAVDISYSFHHRTH